MSRECAVCGKTANKANKISFSHKASVHRQVPNLQTVTAVIDGKVQKVYSSHSRRDFDWRGSLFVFPRGGARESLHEKGGSDGGGYA